MFHYFITIMFFLVLLISTLILTSSLNNMNVIAGDTDGQDAETAMKTAVMVGWISIILIVFGLLGVTILGFKGGFEYAYFKESLSSITKEEEIFVALRVLVFSILVISSFIVAVLLAAAAEFITNSVYSDNYSQQYDDCKEFSKLMFTHIAILITAQSLVFIYSYTKQFN